MKRSLLKSAGVIAVALLNGYLLLLNSAIADPPTTPLVVSPHSLLSLPYHGEATAQPHSVSLFWGESNLYVGTMLCSDKARNIYIYDRVSDERCAVKKFNAQGQLTQTWLVNLNGLGGGFSATVLPDGKVWLNLGVGAIAGEKSGLPFIVLQPGQEKPIADWQQLPPKGLDEILYGSVTPEMWQAMPAPMRSQTRTWIATELSSIGGKVTVNLTNTGGGPTYYPPEAKITPSPKLSWQLLISGDGKQLLQAKPIGTAEPNFSFRSTGGALWHGEYDTPTRPQNWTKMWVWKDGQPKGEPLITRAELTQPRQAWHKLIGSQPQSPPYISVDGKDNIYLNWHREATGPERQFTSGTQSWSRPPLSEDYGERAVVVLDVTRKFVTLVPWTKRYYGFEDWIAPVPDGSGFYRSEFGPKAMEIYWHPLPNFQSSAKAPSEPAKPQPKKQ